MDSSKESCASQASGERILENALKKMKQEWKNVRLPFVRYRDTKLSIVTSTDDIQALLEDHIVKTATMKNSSVLGLLKIETNQWNVTLNQLSDMVDSWMSVQTTWLYLEPVFRCEDIRKQLPKEGKMFAEVDKNWRSILTRAVKTPEAMAILSQENMLEELQQLKSMINEIQKGMNDYLEAKRQAFPRFYFLSNDDLLQILSIANDPVQVVPHLHKCFDNIDGLTFTPDNIIIGMESSEKETVEFCNKINPADAKGQVEKLFLQIMEEMKTSVKSVFFKGVDAYGKVTRSEWAQQYPGQVVLGGSNVHWTAEVTQAIKGGQLGAYVQQCMKQIEEIVKLIRGPLSSNIRTKLQALITLDVHAKDVVKRLHEAKVKTPADFEWLMQLRSYQDKTDFVLRMVTTTVPYGYEYLGNTPRLVLTPLTDRCYITLMNAVALNLGGSPQGPAGTGKTETVKDLAKALGKMCVVINCSDQIDYKGIGQFFKGLAQAGAWSCFDEFNRIHVEVLSVIAQQIQTIQRAVSEKLKTFVLEGTELTLDPACGIFVTMNPGYAGRTELPDNLKMMFRPIAMMVPDYCLIAIIMLYSNGFVEAESLARKLVSVFKHCSEQQSSQCHYDYGMRAVKMVATTVSALKRKYPDEQEKVLMLRALRHVCQAKLVSADIPLFECILSDTFPGVEIPKPDNKAFESAIVKSIEKMGLQAVPYFVEKILQINNIMEQRHGVMVVGDALGGKTSAYKVLADTLTELNRIGFVDGCKVDYKIVNPKAVTLEELYGRLDPVSHEWTDGVLTTIFREQCTKTDNKQWLVVDGPVDAIWAENLNAVLDDNKKMMLANGEVLNLGKKQTVLFEAMDCEVASPAFVSRNGMIYMDSEQLGWQPLVKSWIEQNLTNKLAEQNTNTIKMLFDWLLPPSLNFIQKSCKQLVNCDENHLTMSMLKLFSCLLEDIKQSGQDLTKEAGSNMLMCQFLFSLVWSVGGALDEDSRIKFDEFFRALCEMQGSNTKYPKPEKVRFSSALMIPKKGLIYDYFYLPKQTGSWNGWNTLVTPTAIDETVKISELIVSTSESERQKYFLGLMTRQSKPLLLIGPTGTGKSLVTNKFLSTLPRDKYASSCFNFSAHTLASQIQDTIISRLERRKTAVYGPAPGTQMVVFVDDLNMPAKEVYGAQPPIELLRQWLDHGFWYDRKDCSMQELVDVSLLCAMGPPGGGRNNIGPRLPRHCNVISTLTFDEETMKNIFTPVMDWHFSSLEAGHKKWSRVIVSATLEIYKKAISNLLPTPSKPHYAFNFRDIARVVQGVLSLKSKVIPAGEEGAKKIVCLWMHEVYREFYDKLVEDNDRHFFFQAVKSCAETQFKEAKITVTEEKIRSLLFGDCLSKGKEEKLYDEIQNLDQLKKTAEQCLEAYNRKNRDGMNLVMFRYALEHISKISRVLRQQNGHCLLVGLPGSGRRSSAKLAAFMSGLDLFTVEITQNYSIQEWREDIRHLMRKVGLDGTAMVFLLQDNQIKNDSFLDDINMILNTGDTHSLFDVEEKEEIIEKMKELCLKEKSSVDQTPLSMYRKFTERVRSNLHVVLTFSPTGESFRNKIRMFPSLINCCTVDWFKTWPDDALESVADRYLEGIQMTKEVKTGTVAMLKHFHKTVTALSERFHSKTGRTNHVTPGSYLELVKTFKNLVNKKCLERQDLKNKYQTGLERVAALEKQAAGRSVTAKKIMSSLVEEKNRWTQCQKELSIPEENVHGDLLLSAGVISYLGPFFPTERQDCLQEWHSMCRKSGVPVSEKFSLKETLGNPVQLKDWHMAGLPVDSYSVDNAVIAKSANRWPLMIDPQGQANRWIKNMEKAQLEVIKLSDPNYLRRLENCIQFGSACLLENIGEELDPILEPVFRKKTFKQGDVEYIRIGDDVMEYNPEFTLYMTTRLSNPSYMPEVSVRVTLLNFAMTPAGLESHLAGLVASLEDPQFEDRRNLLVDGARMKQQLREQEDRIFDMLSDAEGDILEDETTLEILSSCKGLSSEISEKQKIANKTEEEIDAMKDKYLPVGKHASAIFFAISDLANIDPMYQYSLTWFVHLLQQSVQNSKPSAKLEERLASLNSHFTYSIYKNVCRSLFEKDKLLFSFLLSTGILKAGGKIDDGELRFLATGGLYVENPLPNPAPQWMTDKSWAEIVRCSDLPAFKGLADHVKQNVAVWKKIFDSPSPQTEKLPEPWSSKMTRLEKLIILRCLRPEKMVAAIQNLVQEEMGPQYIEPPTIDLALTFEDSSSSTPLIYIQSHRGDPMAEITRLAEKKGMNKDGIQTLTLGQGQGPKAERMILQAAKAGTWVVLQDCHLGASWMENLERIYETVISDPSKTKDTFRLWLTSYTMPNFPVSILQNGVKMVSEPERGLKANLLRAFQAQPISDPGFLASSKKPKAFEKLLLSLCFFHAVLLERQRYGPLGFNIAYPFVESDLQISARQLKIFVDDYEQPPLDILCYLTGESNYGGRVTDDKDRRLTISLLKTFYSPEVVSDDKYKFSPSGTYFAPPKGSYQDYLKYINSLPEVAKPEILGLNENATIFREQQESQALLGGILLTLPKQAGICGDSSQDIVEKFASDILAKLPPNFNIEEVQAKYPVCYEDSMNTLLIQELARFNKLIQMIRQNLQNISKAVKGLVVMTKDLQAVLDSMMAGKVPQRWARLSYNSAKPLAAYITDLMARLAYFKNWIEKGAPTVNWLSGMFFPQALLTGVLQNHARQNKIPIDQLGLEFEVMSNDTEMPSKPATGAYIRGLYMEGAKWSREKKQIEESAPKVLHDLVPVIWLKPVEKAKMKETGGYNCPVYITSTRKGVLSTTGHSTNFVMFINFPTDQPENHWINRGVACLCQLDN